MEEGVVSLTTKFLCIEQELWVFRSHTLAWFVLGY